MSPGDICWVDILPRGGHEQAGRRPAIIFQDESLTSLIPTVLIVPVTTQVEAMRFPGTMLIARDAGNGLRRASVALVFQITAVDRRWIGSKLGRIADLHRDELWEQLDRVTGRNTPQ